MADRNADVLRQAAAQQEPSIKWLTRLVIGLGMVLIGGVILLFVLLATGAHLKNRPEAAPAAAEPRSIAVEDFALTLPSNSRVTDVFATGSRAVVRVRLADGTERLYALDATTLKPLNSLTIQVER